MCKHLWNELPKDSSKSVKAYPVTWIERAEDHSNTMEENEETRFREKISHYDLQVEEIEVLTMRYVYGHTLQEIAEMWDITGDRRHIWVIEKRARDKLKERGFKL